MRSILLRLESERTEDKARSVFQVGYNQRDIEKMDLHRSNIEYCRLSGHVRIDLLRYVNIKALAPGWRSRVLQLSQDSLLLPVTDAKVSTIDGVSCIRVSIGHSLLPPSSSHPCSHCADPTPCPVQKPQSDLTPQFQILRILKQETIDYLRP